jgi:hypothetical protein
VNTGKLSFENAAEMIVDLVRKFETVPEVA